MSTNVGNADRGIRVLLGFSMLVLASFVGFDSVLGIILVIVAVIAAVTAAVGFCPLYRVLGINTCQHDPSES